MFIRQFIIDKFVAKKYYESNTWFQFRCVDDMSGIDRSPCCESAKFPYPPHVFEQCLPQIISILYESPRYVFVPGIAGPKFERQPPHNGTAAATAARKIPQVKVVVVEYESTQSYTMSYAEMENFTTTVQDWFSRAMANAPSGMRNAWFISELDFYDLQRTLSEGTIYAICICNGRIADCSYAGDIEHYHQCVGRHHRDPIHLHHSRPASCTRLEAQRVGKHFGEHCDRSCC